MRHLLLTLALIVTVPVQAEQKVNVYGYGTFSCASYVTEYDANAAANVPADSATVRFSPYVVWIDGFLSGYNTSTGKNVFRDPTRRDIWRWVYNWCDERPLELLVQGVMAYVVEVTK